MFSRRIKLTRRQKLREALWPSMGLVRTGKYYRHRLTRLNGSPREIAGGIATGIAISFTPFIGFHILMGLLIARAFKFSVFGMAVGTLIGGNPWTFPFIWVGSYKLGHMILGHGVLDVSALATKTLSFADILEHPMEWLVPMMIGSLPLAAVGWVVSYKLSKRLVIRYRAGHLERLTKVLA